MLERHQESDECFSFLRSQPHEAAAGSFSFPAVPKNSFVYAASAAIVQEHRVAVHRLHETDAPERRGTPLRT